jgi:glycosyltransferase involved in cell wall biosynthesis
MRVAYVIEQCWHRVPGGTAVAALELARALTARPDLELVGIAARHAEPPPPEWRPPIEVRHLRLPRPLLYESWHLLGRPRIEDVDVIHATGLAVPPRTAPLVTTIHDLSFLVYPEHFSRAGRRFFGQVLRRTRERADLVLCSSRATLKHCARAGLERGRLRHVPLGVRAPVVREEEVVRVRKEYGLSGPYVLWTGTIEPRKNLRRLLEAWGSVRSDAELVLVGPRGWNEELEERPGVRMLGFVPWDDLGALYAGAEAFVFPSLMEGFGFPVLEAMAQGTPVVTSRGTSTEELAHDAGVLVDPRDPGDIARGLERVLREPALARELREAGPRRAAEYTWARTAELVRTAYEDVRPRPAADARSGAAAPRA